MIGKLKTLEEITDQDLRAPWLTIEHKKGGYCIRIKKENYDDFGKIINVEIWKEFEDRTVYKSYYQNYRSKLYYKEWFVWLWDEEVKHLPEELWNMKDL